MPELRYSISGYATRILVRWYIAAPREAGTIGCFGSILAIALVEGRGMYFQRDRPAFLPAPCHTIWIGSNFEPWLKRIEELPTEAVEEIFEALPSSWRIG